MVTPSTPRPQVGALDSPAFEPVSPPPAPASSSRTVSAVPSFSGGFGAGSTSYTAGGGYSGMGLSRLPVGVSSSGANATNNDSIAGNTRKKARLA